MPSKIAGLALVLFAGCVTEDAATVTSALEEPVPSSSPTPTPTPSPSPSPGPNPNPAPGGVMCKVINAAAKPVAVDLPDGLFPTAPAIVMTMIGWVNAQCPLLFPNTAWKFIPDDVTAELKTEWKDPKAIDIQATSHSWELDSYRQLLSYTRILKDKAGVVLDAKTTTYTTPDPTTLLDCEVTCGGTLAGTLITATILKEYANNPAGILPPGFFKTLFGKFAAQTPQIDCTLASATKWAKHIELLPRRNATVKKSGAPYSSDDDGTVTAAEKLAFPAAVTAIDRYTYQGWVHDIATDTPICAANMTEEQRNAACVAAAPETPAATYTVKAGICAADKPMPPPPPPPVETTSYAVSAGSASAAP